MVPCTDELGLRMFGGVSGKWEPGESLIWSKILVGNLEGRICTNLVVVRIASLNPSVRACAWPDEMRLMNFNQFHASNKNDRSERIKGTFC